MDNDLYYKPHLFTRPIEGSETKFDVSALIPVNGTWEMSFGGFRKNDIDPTDEKVVYEGTIILENQIPGGFGLIDFSQKMEIDTNYLETKLVLKVRRKNGYGTASGGGGAEGEDSSNANLGGSGSN